MSARTDQLPERVHRLSDGSGQLSDRACNLAGPIGVSGAFARSEEKHAQERAQGTEPNRCWALDRYQWPGGSGNRGRMSRKSRHIRPLWLVGAVLSLGLVVGGCGTSGNSAAPPSTGAATHAQASGPVSTSPEPSMARSIPVSLRIPAIDAQSSLVELGLNPDQTVQLPPVSTPMQAGWYEYGPTPGQIGPAVILGHVDGDKQAGIFFRLHELKPGDQIQVTRQDGSTATFTVTRLQEVAKNQFPSEEVYGNTSDAELRLITCGGSFDYTVHSYEDNVIVFATLA